MTNALFKIGIYGASGRMGKSVIELVETTFRAEASIAAKLDRTQGQLADFSFVDAIIDFSLPDGTSKLLDWLEAQPPGQLPLYLCGTTGLSESQHARINALGNSTLVMYAANFSAGAAALSAILKFAAPMLKALSYQAGITDTHHVHKIDIPSGTAKVLKEIVDPGGVDGVQINSIQEGEVVGKIDVVFAGVSDQITIGINVEDRTLFARGAIDAALWLDQLGAKTGFYTMDTCLQARLN